MAGRARTPPARPPRARRPPGRDGPRGRQLLVVLALVDVLLDGRPDDLPARVRLRLRLAGQHGRGLRLHRLRRHRDRRHHGAVLGRASRRCTRRSSSTSSSTPTTRSSPRRSTPRSWSPAEALWIAARTGVYGCVPMLVAMVFGLDPSWGMLLVPFIAALAGLGWACFGIFIAAQGEGDRELLLLAERPADADVPGRRHVLPAQRAAAVGAGAGQLQPAVPLRPARPRTPSSASRAGPTSATWRSWSASRSSPGGWRSATWSAG